jgi:hypothetical protein
MMFILCHDNFMKTYPVLNSSDPAVLNETLQDATVFQI